jgi:UDPglucose--hexose-1-phosphate uridylyltransferase
MAELRRDPITGRWSIIATKDGKYTLDFETESHTSKGGMCPFCYGNEDKTPPEIDAHREGGSKPNTPGWSTRTVPNKFPALRVEGLLSREGVGIYDVMNGIGAHEVIIETPEHEKNIPDLPDHHVEKIVWAYRNRSVDLRGDTRFRYILVFKNYGLSAGASLEHPHSQLIALPVVPKRVLEEVRGAESYFEYRERCIFCDMIRQEVQDAARLICENKNFVSFAPFAPRFPFEVWIVPRVHCSDFSLIQAEEVVDLARILKEVLGRVSNTLRDPSYNYIIHTAPIDTRQREDYHWHVEIMPKLMKVAGFEWGSGFYINPVAPEDAARFLREGKIDQGR